MADEPPFVITAGFGDGVTQVAVTGALDIATVQALDEMLSVVLDRQPGRLVIDLSGVPYLGCAAARVIGEAAQALQGHQLLIWEPAPIVRRLLQLTGLATLIEDSHPAPPDGARWVSLPQRNAVVRPETVAVTAAVEGRIWVLTVTGELDLAAVSGFAAQTAKTMAALDGQPERLVLDLGGLAFLDCAGARALEQMAGTVPAGCPVIVRAVSRAADRVLKLTGLNLERPPAPDVVVLPDEQLTQRVQMTSARMAEMASSIRETAVHLAGTGDRIAATFARLAEQRPHDADRLSALSTAAHEFATRSRRHATLP